MATETPSPLTPALPISEERLKKAVEFIEEDEGATSQFRGWLARVTTALLVAMSLFHLYAAVDIVPAQVLRPVHVGWVLMLVFLLFPVAKRFRNRLMWWDVILALAAVATVVYLLAGGDDFWDRNTLPDRWDVIMLAGGPPIKESVDDTEPLGTGLALSGGGIRSATFSLGVLQAIAQRRHLGRFDFLSTVSGGGYAGSWLSAWVDHPFA